MSRISFSYLVEEEIMISGQILIETHKKVNGCKSLKNAYMLMKLYQIAHFYDPCMKNKAIFKNYDFWTKFQKLKFLDPLKEFPDF